MIAPIKSPNITGVYQDTIVGLYFEKTAAQNMSRLIKSYGEITHIEGRMIIHRFKIVQTLHQILIVIEPRQIKPLPLHLLKLPTIPQHNVGESHRGRRTKNPHKILRTLPQRKKKRQSPTMINVSMGQNNRIHTINKLQGRILSTLPLLNPTIQKNPSIIRLEQNTATPNLTNST